MFSVFSFHVLHLPFGKHEAWYIHIEGVAKDWRQNLFLQKMVTVSMKILTRSRDYFLSYNPVMCNLGLSAVSNFVLGRSLVSLSCHVSFLFSCVSDIMLKCMNNYCLPTLLKSHQASRG